MASRLFLLETGSIEKTKEAFRLTGVKIHFYNDAFAIGSTGAQVPAGSVILDDKAWADPGIYYFILNFNPGEKENYIQTITRSANILYQDIDYIIVSSAEQQAAQLYPAIHGGMIRITETPAKFPSNSFDYKPGTMNARDDIFAMIAKVSADTLEQFVQHLQDYGTRNAYKPESILAQNWILGKFQSYGLSTELYDFYMPGGPASDDVIATLTGTTYPDEYVILGAHYDSYAGGNNEPGADDNATGAAGILEAARILSHYQFDRSIIFATWSGEEYGLYGSQAWVSEAEAGGMNILGYFNIDMAGYLQEGDVIHTDIICPASANDLKQFYKDVCAIYLPDFPTHDGTLSNGDSDHTSFNEHGYQGIFPFEDVEHYSPYIHTPNDLIGPSVNSFAQHLTFVQAIMASVVTMAEQPVVQENLVALSGNQEVNLIWEAVGGTDHYNIYRAPDSIPYAASTGTAFLDTNVVNGTRYFYHISAVSQFSGNETVTSNKIMVTPILPVSLPFFDDFETDAPYWAMEDTWGLQSLIYHSSTAALTESPAGDYNADMNASATLRALNFTGATSAQISFWTRYNIEKDYDYMYLEVSTNGTDWDEIASFNGDQDAWVMKTYSLDDYINESNVIIRFHFISDAFTQEGGMYIDDLEIDANGVGLDDGMPSPLKTNLLFQPNPARTSATLNYWLENSGMTKIYLTDSKGMLVKTLVDKWKDSGTYSFELEVSDLPGGIYIATIENNGRKINRKLVITR
jgi:Zn-dependent M28 family amino/carboxypeptidase